MRKFKKVYYVEKKADLRRLLEELNQLGYTWLSGASLSLKDNYTNWFINEAVEFPVAINIGEDGKVTYLQAEDEETEFTLGFLKRLEGGEVEYYGDIDIEIEEEQEQEIGQLHLLVEMLFDIIRGFIHLSRS